MLSYYKICFTKKGKKRFYFWRITGNTANSAEAVFRTLYPQVTIQSVTMDVKRTKKMHDSIFYRDLWDKAIQNMPYKRIINGEYVGQFKALATILRMNSRQVFSYSLTGKTPGTKWKTQALKKLASPYGQLFARIHLRKIKKDKNQKWPRS